MNGLIQRTCVAAGRPMFRGGGGSEGVSGGKNINFCVRSKWMDPGLESLFSKNKPFPRSCEFQNVSYCYLCTRVER